MSLLLLPPDALVEICIRVIAPPFAHDVGALACACRATAAMSRSHALWAGALRAAHPEAWSATADAPALRDAYVMARWHARARWRAALERARAALDVPLSGSTSETTSEWAQIALLSYELRMGGSGTAAAQTELLSWACTTQDPLAIACALVVLDASGRFDCRLDAAFADASSRAPSVRAETIRVLSWSLGGKDLRGYRCRDDMRTYAITLAQLADPARHADAAAALAVLQRGVVHEVRKVVLEARHHPAL